MTSIDHVIKRLNKLKLSVESGVSIERRDPYNDAIEDCKSFLRQTLTQWVEDLIGEDEWEDPDIRGNKSHGDPVISPWMRNKLRVQLRTKAGLTPPQEGE